MISADASCAPCLYLLKWSSLFLKEFTVEADITSSGSAFHAFTTLILKHRRRKRGGQGGQAPPPPQ